MLPKDYTKQEQVIAEVLSTIGLRYDQQVPIGNFTVDFYIPELKMVIEADGIYGHLKKRDVKRDSQILSIYGVENILHIKDNFKVGVTNTLWQALNKLGEENPSPKLENAELLSLAIMGSTLPL